jgi:hypothetical protein
VVIFNFVVDFFSPSTEEDTLSQLDSDMDIIKAIRVVFVIKNLFIINLKFRKVKIQLF